MNRSKNFNTSAPINYVAGLGRGATGFTTRSDIGPARMGAEQEGKAQEANLNDNNFDKFSGYSEQLFGDLPYDDDDEAADLVWGEIDMKMDERRKSRREARVEEQMEKYRAVRPKLQHQFTDLKRDLSYVTDEEWDALPEPGEHRKHRAAEKRNERFFTPMPDSLLEKARMKNEVHTSLDTKQMSNAQGGMETPMGMQTPMSGGATPLTDLKSIGEAREAVLSVNNLHGIMRATEAGIGLSGIPDYMTALSRRLVRILPQVKGESFDVFFVYPSELRGSVKAKVFREFLVRVTKNWQSED